MDHPCTLHGWWSHPWEHWVVQPANVVLPMVLQFPSAPLELCQLLNQDPCSMFHFLKDPNSHLVVPLAGNQILTPWAACVDISHSDHTISPETEFSINISTRIPPFPVSSLSSFLFSFLKLLYVQCVYEHGPWTVFVFFFKSILGNHQDPMGSSPQWFILISLHRSHLENNKVFTPTILQWVFHSTHDPLILYRTLKPLWDG